MRSSDWSSRVLFRSTSAVVPVFAFPMTSTRTTASLDILKRVDSRGPGHPPWQGRNYAIHRLVLPVAIGKKIEDTGIGENLRIEGISRHIVTPLRYRQSTPHRR